MPILMMLSREVRRVPLDWKHPKDEGGRYRPLLSDTYADASAAWQKDKARWERGEYDEWVSDDSKALSFEDYNGHGALDEDDYMPTFPADATLGICMYEEVSEGTPISPVFPDTDEGRICMASYLAANPRGITAGMTDADWRAIIDGGHGTKDIHTGEIEVR